MTPHLVVIGTGYAGLLAALRAARIARGRIAVTLVGASDQLVERVRLHELAATGRSVAHPVAALIAGTAVRFVHARALEVAPGRLVTDAGVLEFDRAIVCTGGSVDLDLVPGAREHAYAIDGDRATRLFSEARRVAARGGRLAVCGGGLTGVEIATELAEALPGLRVELVAASELVPGLSRKAREHARAVLGRLGVAVREGVRVHAVAADHLDSAAGPIGFDLCAWAAGFRAVPLLAGLGLPMAADGRVIVDAYLHARPDLLVAGDAAACAATGGGWLGAGCKTAMPMAAHAADTAVAELTGGAVHEFRFADPGYCVSLGRRDGILQFMDGAGRPRERIVKGRVAAWIKERVCQYTVLALRAEQRRLLAYRWQRGPARPLVAVEAAQ
ncbi:FAD-dependent oxidoreductase [Nannocystis sp. ILAH1]|uniref:NAD(P)/FAD-dependent oxidoreductase n=1 Tax=Nannocystis sp. ILAH1 TaxID=2996789 RepID=UPI00226D56F7|nr:FAD-dependent oxidoreductase [Nannocystis sp. ILAH1]MCY0988885.1 FAD-dependent oxidoreductase [Nannocystis sp. ILAH1]